MKSNSSSLKALLAAATLLLSSADIWARLPAPFQQQGAITSVDHEARVIVLAEPTKPRFRLGKIVKPNSFVWTETTQFIKNGQPSDASALSPNVRARLHYLYPPKKGRPFLVKVVWRNEDK